MQEKVCGKILYARERVWQDIICKRKSERQRAPEMAEQVCTYLPALPGILTKRREY